MILFLLLFLMGCQAEHPLSGNEALFAHEHAELNDAESSVLKARIEQLKSDLTQHIVIAVPTPMTQSKRFSRAFWQSKKVYLQTYLTQQGVSNQQIEFKECVTCSAIQIT